MGSDSCETCHERRIYSQRFLEYGVQVWKLRSTGESNFVVQVESIADFRDQTSHHKTMLAEIEDTTREQCCRRFVGIGVCGTVSDCDQ